MTNNELYTKLLKHALDHYEVRWRNDKEIEVDLGIRLLLTTKEYFPYQYFIIDGINVIMNSVGVLQLPEHKEYEESWELLESIGFFKSYFIEE